MDSLNRREASKKYRLFKKKLQDQRNRFTRDSETYYVVSLKDATGAFTFSSAMWAGMMLRALRMCRVPLEASMRRVHIEKAIKEDGSEIPFIYDDSEIKPLTYKEK